VLYIAETLRIKPVKDRSKTTSAQKKNHEKLIPLLVRKNVSTASTAPLSVRTQLLIFEKQRKEQQ